MPSRPLETFKDIEDGIRIQAKILAAQGDHAGSVQALRTLLSSKYRAADLEIKGLNLRQSEGNEDKLTLNDYRQPYQQELAENKELSERVEALEAQITAMQGKDLSLLKTSSDAETLVNCACWASARPND